MRIIRDNKIYIQKNDIAYLNMSDEQYQPLFTINYLKVAQ